MSSRNLLSKSFKVVFRVIDTFQIFTFNLHLRFPWSWKSRPFKRFESNHHVRSLLPLHFNILTDPLLVVKTWLLLVVWLHWKRSHETKDKILNLSKGCQEIIMVRLFFFGESQFWPVYSIISDQVSDPQVFWYSSRCEMVLISWN